ncbi:hypothetical protein N8881_04770 [Pseudomonadales bacterium]|nr:hypothetical protein [Pseudomonadales bacterium]MDC1016845.1 hypothetical protein [Pseudomonadales bacterium]
MMKLNIKTIHLIVVSIFLSISTVSFADVVEVFQWKAFPGKGQDMLEGMSKAAKIYASEGGQVSIDAHNIGSTQLINYVIRWDNSKDYARSKDLQRSSKAWADFWAESNANPAGELVASFSANNLDPTKKASDFKGSYVYSAAIWKVNPGKDLALITRFMEAKPILEAAGARVEIYAGGWGAPGEYHYVLMFDSWTALEASFSKLGPGSDWAKLMQKRSSETGAGEQIGYITAQTMN